ncbi:unnamed protein product [Caenorhabditis nigoni]
MNSKTEKPKSKHIALFHQYVEKMFYPKINIHAGSNVPEALKKAWKAKHAISSKKRCQRFLEISKRTGPVPNN